MAFKFNVPDNFADITVGQWYDYKNAKTDVERLMAIGKISKEDAMSVRVTDVKLLIDLFNKVLSNESAIFTPIVKVNKRNYGFIPNLYQMTAGEYADLITFCKDINANIVKIMGVLYRPVLLQVGNKYRIENYDILKRELYEDDIRQVSMEAFAGAMVFFSTLANELSNTSLDSLRQEITKATKEVIQLMQEKE